MKLRRAWPAICIWVIFLIFDIVMVASYSYFSGLFPAKNLLYYAIGFTVISIFVMSLLTFYLGRFCDKLDVRLLLQKKAVKIIYPILVVLIVVGGIWYRAELLASATGDIIGKRSLYENAMIGGTSITREYDLLSIVYSCLLKVILIFTGNIISVSFFFQIACFTVFLICGYFTVKKLLGIAAAFVFTAYAAFMPVFTTAFTGLELSTDSLFMAMFGIELLFVAMFLQGADKGKYTSKAFVIWYIFVGIIVGFMAYVDAGTIIMILPFIASALFLHGKAPLKELVRILFLLLGAVAAFFVMIIQEAGPAYTSKSLAGWGTYYFHNLNTFRMFWTYTDHKIIYLITVVAMSGVIIGFWKNRNFEKISPWLVSMLLIFATVPFMGATRMNTQVFVTVYYAFILGCVASLITLPADETTQEPAKETGEEEMLAEHLAESDGTLTFEEKKMIRDSINQAVSRLADTKDVDDIYIIPKERFVPEGMVLPEDDEDTDLTPRMKMPELRNNFGLDGKPEKLKLKRKINEPKQEEKLEIISSPNDDFDLKLKPGDDFDI